MKYVVEIDIIAKTNQILNKPVNFYAISHYRNLNLSHSEELNK